MATLKTNLIEPEGATTTLTVGESGGNLVMGADSLKANTLKNRGDTVIKQSLKQWVQILGLVLLM